MHVQTNLDQKALVSCCESKLNSCGESMLVCRSTAGAGVRFLDSVGMRWHAQLLYLDVCELVA